MTDEFYCPKCQKPVAHAVLLSDSSGRRHPCCPVCRQVVQSRPKGPA